MIHSFGLQPSSVAWSLRACFFWLRSTLQMFTGNINACGTANTQGPKATYIGPLDFQFNLYSLMFCRPRWSVVLLASSRPIREIALTHQFSTVAGIIIFLQHNIHSSIHKYVKIFTKFRSWSVSTSNPPLQLK